MNPPDDQFKQEPASIPQSAEMLQQMRREARIRKDVVLALLVTLVLNDGQEVKCKCLDASVEGLGLRVPSEGHTPIAVGERVNLTLRHPSRDRAITSVAELSSAQHNGDNVTYGVRFLKVPDVVRQLDPFYRRWLNRRRHVRVMPDLGSRPTALLSWKDGELRGHIHDISLGGLGISVTLKEAGRLMQDARVDVVFSLPSAILPITCSAHVVVVRAFKTAALIGLAFDPNGGIAVHALAIQRYVEARQKEIQRWNDVMARLKSPQ